MSNLRELYRAEQLPVLQNQMFGGLYTKVAKCLDPNATFL